MYSPNMMCIDITNVQEKAKYIHQQASVYLPHFTYAVQCIISIAPSAHNTVAAGVNKVALLLTFTTSEIERHAASYSCAEAVAIYEPNKTQLGSILSGLFHDKVIVSVFTLFDVRQGVDSIAVSIARKYGHHLWSQLSRLDTVDFIDTKRGTKMLCCGHIHKTSQAQGKSMGLSTDIPNSSLSANLSFVLHVMGTVGLLPPTAPRLLRTHRVRNFS